MNVPCPASGSMPPSSGPIVVAADLRVVCRAGVSDAPSLPTELDILPDDVVEPRVLAAAGVEDRDDRATAGQLSCRRRGTDPT